MPNKITQLVNRLIERRGYFFMARLCLKVGRDLTEIKDDTAEDPELFAKIITITKELGVSDKEIEEAILVE
ncbi:MAG: hypothetical protein PHF44_00990 [Candidatus Pacebacteria bacterium]|nr:hypothetical protein [Candidatus Paceibacterota bacterium]